MICKTVRLFAAVALLLCVAGESEAGSFYYNVDSQTLPGGPIELENATATGPTAVMSGYQTTLSGDAYNSSATQTYDNVLFLNQFAYPIPSGAAFTFASGIWSGVGADEAEDMVQLDSPSGFLSMLDTNAPLSYTLDSVVANLAPSDSPPYISIGDIGPGQSIPFSFTVDMSTAAPFNLNGSFVSTTPVPEPSTLILACVGAIGLLAAARRRRAGDERVEQAGCGLKSQSPRRSRGRLA
jgi:hypothetical protein